MTALKGGDRVSIYGSTHLKFAGSNQIDFLRGKHGTVLESPCAPGEYEVKSDDGFLYTCHPKQLRRIKPKPKAESKPRRWTLKYSPGAKQWVEAHPRSGHVAFPDQENVCVVEILPGSAVVSRRQLAVAWNENGGTREGSSSDYFDTFCKVLNLPSPEGKSGKG